MGADPISAGIGLGSAALGAVGSSKGKKGEAPAQSGYAAMPKEWQELINKQLLPEIQDTYDYLNNTPMARVMPQEGPFANPQLYALQVAADMRAGISPEQDQYYGPAGGQQNQFNVSVPYGPGAIQGAGGSNVLAGANSATSPLFQLLNGATGGAAGNSPKIQSRMGAGNPGQTALSPPDMGGGQPQMQGRQSWGPGMGGGSNMRMQGQQQQGGNSDDAMMDIARGMALVEGAKAKGSMMGAAYNPYGNKPMSKEDYIYAGRKANMADADPRFAGAPYMMMRDDDALKKLFSGLDVSKISDRGFDRDYIKGLL